MKFRSLRISLFAGVAYAAISISTLAAGPILMVHGHADNPSLWTIQGPALVRASGGARFYDPKWYFVNELPARFQSNGIYGVTYYSRTSADGLQPAPISPVRFGNTEFAPDDPALTAFLFGQPDSYAARLAVIIDRANAETGQKVTLVCHSMGGLVALSTVAWFGTSNKVDKIITIGSPLRGFPPDFRIPADIIGLDRTGLFREGLQMSEGVTYDAQSFSAILEDRFRRFKAPTLSVVSIVGTLSPFPRGFLVANENDDGVVVSRDQRFRDPSLATVYEVPLTHIDNYRALRYGAQDVECLSDRTTQILEKEVLGLNPLPRLATSLSFNYNTAKIRVTVRNDGGLPVTFSAVSGRFDILGPRGRTAGDPLSGLAGQTLQPGQFLTVDGIAMNRGEKGEARLTLTVNGQQLPPGDATWIANIQAPEIEASLRYDFANSVLRSEWDIVGGGQRWPISWNAQYRLEGAAVYDAVSNRLKGTLTAHLFGAVTGQVASVSNDVFFSESFAFDLDPATRTFTELGATVLGKTPLLAADAASSRLRHLYRAKLLPLVTNPGPFIIEGSFSGAAGFQLDRPVFHYDPETQGLGLNINAKLVFAFSDGQGDRVIEIPIQASCSAIFVNDQRGFVVKPRVRKLTVPGLSLSENYRLQINRAIEANDFVVAPGTLAASLNQFVREGLVSFLGAGGVPANYALFETVTLAIESDSARLRILIDLYDDALNGNQNTYAGVPQNGIAFQDRLVNELLRRNRPLVNAALDRSGVNNFPIGVEFRLPFTQYYFDTPTVLSFGVGFDGVYYYIDRLHLNVAENADREFQILFTGPDNRTHFDVPVNADFYTQRRYYFGIRIGFSLPFIGFIGYTERFEKEEWRAHVTERLSVDVDGNVYPYLRENVSVFTDPSSEIAFTNRGASVGLRFPPREIEIETVSQDSSILAGILGETVAEPLFALARDNPQFFGLVGAAVGGLYAGLFPGPATDLGAQFGGAAGFNKLVEGTTNQFLLDVKSDLDQGSGRFTVDLTSPAAASVRPLLAWGGFQAGAIAGGLLTPGAEAFFAPKNVEGFVQLPAGIQATGLTVANRAASASFEIDPIYGDLMVTSITGLDATNGLVQLSRDDLVFTSDGNKLFALTYAAENKHFNDLWVKKPVPAIRLAFRYEAPLVNRYNDPAYPGFSLKFKHVGGSPFTVPANYAYDPQTDTATFSVDIPLLEGVSSIGAFQLNAPRRGTIVVPFLTGRDTAPILINAPFAAYSGVSSNVTVQAGTVVYRVPDAPAPAFSVTELKLLTLTGEVNMVDLRPRGLLTERTVGPADTRINQLYGAEFTWTGNLSPSEFPEGAYAVLVTLREASLNKKGSLLIPLLIDRTPPRLEGWTVAPGPPVVSRHVDLPLVWRLNDNLSAVMHDVNATYQKPSGPVQTGAVFAAERQVMIGGQRRFSFTPDLSSVPDGVEETYTLKFHATDVPGNRGVSSNLQFIVDTRPPSLDSLFVYPASAGPFHAIINQSNRILTVKVESSEPFTARFRLTATNGVANDWFTVSSTNATASGRYRSIWLLELPALDARQGLLDGVVADGVYRLSVELVDRGNNTNSFPNLRTLLVDRSPPVMSFRSQQTFIPAGRTVYPLGINLSGFRADDRITSIALVNLNGFNATSSVYSATLRTWTGGQMAGVLAGGLPLAPLVPGTFLAPGHYGVEVKARDDAGNESRLTTQFGYQLMLPHVEVQGAPRVGGITPVVGIAVDPNPADRFPFRNRELYWALGANVPVPTNLAAINPAVWRTAGLYVLPPRGAQFAASDNASAEMVAEGILGYWNTTSTALAFEGDSQAMINAAGLVNSDTTVLLVVRDQGGQAWARTASVHVDNRQTDINALTAPGVRLLSATVNNRQLQVSAALLRDTPVLQMLVLDANGNVVHRQTRANVESRNNLIGRPTYSLENDFGFFVWYDEAAGQLKVRCVAPEKSSQGVPLTKGHTFYFSLRGDFCTNDLSFHQLAPAEIPTGERVFTSTNGASRVTFTLNVAPGTEEGVAVNYHGGTIDFNPLGIDDYLQALYENGPVVEKRFWRADDAASVFSGYLGISPVRNVVGLEGIVMNGGSPELEDQRAVAHHSGVLGHVFAGRSRTEPISPLGLRFDSATVQPDLTLTWDLKLPNGSCAEPGQYQAYLYTMDDQAGRFHGARSMFTVSRGDVPFGVSGLRLSGNGAFNPSTDGGIILNFNATRSATATVQILNASNQVVAMITQGQFIQGRTDTNNPHQVWWDGYIDGAPASAGNYSFQLIFTVTDGVSYTNSSGSFAVSYPANVPRESDWGLLTQPIAFDPDTRDRIIGTPGQYDSDSRAWVTLRFNARLADGTTTDAEKQVPLKWRDGDFQSVETDTNTSPVTYIAVSALFGDAVQRFENIKVKFNDRVVDVFPPLELSPSNTNFVSSRAGQFEFKVNDPGPKALRLQVILRAQLRPWTNNLSLVLNELNQLFDQDQVREFVFDLEFREKPGTNGVLQSLPWNFRHVERLVGYVSTSGVLVPHYGYAVLDNLLEIEIRDRNGQQTLARFNSWQIRPGGVSAIEQLFTLSGFANGASADAVALDFVFENRMDRLQAKAAFLGVPVTFGYAAINASLLIPTATTATITDSLDPFPTRHYHANGKRTDSANGGRRYDNVKAYSGDSGLVQEINFSSNRIAGHVPFQYSIRPLNDGNKGQQTIQIHPWIPFSLMKPASGTVWMTEGSQRGAYLGSSVSSAGDVNGDGYADIIVSAPEYSNDENREGRAFVYLGSPTGLTNAPSWITEGNHTDGEFGFSVSSAGDVNGDGYSDVIVGEPGYSNHAGRVLVYCGSSTGLHHSVDWVAVGSANGITANGILGSSVSSAGDVNGDGYSDIIVGEPGYSNFTGRALAFHGSSTGLCNSPVWMSVDHSCCNGSANVVSSAGDVNGDGYGDVLIGSPYANNGLGSEGRTSLYLGGPGGLRPDPAWTKNFGSSVNSAGDVNADGYGDVIVSEYDFGFGRAFVYLGSASGLRTDVSWSAEGNQPFAGFGYSVGSAGDVNGDGYGDVIVGASYTDNFGENSGSVFLYLGSPTGLAANAAWTADGDRAIGYFGSSVGGAGDINGDGFSDVIVGAPGGAGIETDRGAIFLYVFPRTAIFYRGWVRAGLGGGADLGLRGPNPRFVNLLTNPIVNTAGGCMNRYQVDYLYDRVSKRDRVTVTYSCGQSGYTTNAPFPLDPSSAEQWLSRGFYDAAGIAQFPVPVGTNGLTNADWQLNLKFAATPDDLFIAWTPDAFDAVVTNGLVDFSYVPAADALYNPTLDYLSDRTAWEHLEPRLPRSPSGLPAVQTDPAVRPRLTLTNFVLHPDTNFPAITTADLGLAFSEDPTPDGGEHAFIQSRFSHEATGYYRPWLLGDDPNVRTAAEVAPENVQVTLNLDGYDYDSSQGRRTNSGATLLNGAPHILPPGSAVALTTPAATPDNQFFQRFISATVAIRITRSSDYSGESETNRLERLDLTVSNRTFRVRTARYVCDLTPVISGPAHDFLAFRLEVTLDPPVEFSTRRPLRRTNSVALPLKVIDREKFWQVDAGEYTANLFKEVAIEGPASSGAGYIVNSNVGYTTIGGRRPIATDPDYAAKANALFWKTTNGTIVPNPRIILGGLSVVLKDPSGREETPAFQEKRYVAAVTNEYFNDLYLDSKDFANLSWKAKIRPQAKEHAYVKVYGSVGGSWMLSYRRKESGQLSGLLPQDAGSLTWTTIISGSGYGQNQFLTYWDITELNGPHILRLESATSPDYGSTQPEVKYLDVMLGQHLPGRNNPIFSPGGVPETVSLFSMFGRTQLTSAPEDRGDDDLFFTVNPIKVEERPFSLGTNGTIPLGERVQVLPHTEHNPLSVNFYIDRQEYGLYDQFRLYHQLEAGELIEIASLPPSVRPKYTLIQGFVEHTSIVGFLPNPSLRLVTLNVPRVSPDGIIRVAGAVDLYGTDASMVKNEDLIVAIVVSPTSEFYSGQVKARLTTGMKAEFPTAAQASQANVSTTWTPGSPPQTFHVFAVVVSTNDDWLTLNRQLAPADADQHLFNVSRTTVTMTTNVNNSLLVDGLPIFSPNGDGVADTIRFQFDFGREGLVQLEFRNEFGQSVHLSSASLGTNGQASFIWDGYTTGLGTLRVAPDGIYTVTARYADGQYASEAATTVVEVRAFSKYFGQLLPAGVTNNTGAWRTVWTHLGGVIYTNDVVRLQYSDTTNFATLRGDRLVDRQELSALFDDSPTNLAAFVTDTNGNLNLRYRLSVTDEVGNTGLSPAANVALPSSGRLIITSVTPPNGVTNVSTEPPIIISLASASPFTAAELDGMFALSPSVPRSVALSANRQAISVTPLAPFAPNALVSASLQRFPGATGTNVFVWSFRVLSTNLISRALTARLVGVPASLDELGSETTALVVVTNRGNVPARLSVSAGAPSTNILAVTATNAPLVAFPSNEVAIPFTLAVTGAYRGNVFAPLTLTEQTVGTVTSLVVNVSISSITSAPTLVVFMPSAHPSNAFLVSFAGRSRGNGLISTLARVNGSSWWVVSQQEFWSFDASFTSDGDVLEILARDEQNRASTTYAYTFTGPPLRVAIQSNQGLAWDAQLGRTYAVEWSTNLENWATVTGAAVQTGATVNVTPGPGPVQISDAPIGRIFVQFTPTHEAASSTNAFFRVRSNR